MTDADHPVCRTWAISHPDLDGPLVLDSFWSERVTLHFGMMKLMQSYPDHDFGAPHTFTITEVGDMGS